MENCLARQTARADPVAGLPLPGLRRMAEPVRSTRLRRLSQQCSTFILCEGNWKIMTAFSPKSLHTKRLHAQFIGQFSHWSALPTFTTMSAKR